MRMRLKTGLDMGAVITWHRDGLNSLVAAVDIQCLDKDVDGLHVVDVSVIQTSLLYMTEAGGRLQKVSGKAYSNLIEECSVIMS